MPSTNSGGNPLASTAYWIAAIRAHESKRSDRLFNDPWAALLAGQVGPGWFDRMPTELNSGNEIVIAIRTKFFDDFLSRAVTEHQIRQVVLMAAGMDTRAFRLAWPEGTRLFELDQPELLIGLPRMKQSKALIEVLPFHSEKISTNSWANLLNT